MKSSFHEVLYSIGTRCQLQLVQKLFPQPTLEQAVRLSPVSAIMASVLVFGATGIAGIYIINALVAAKSSFARLGIFTSQTTVDNKAELIQRLKGEGVHVHVGDVGSDEDVLAAYKGR